MRSRPRLRGGVRRLGVRGQATLAAALVVAVAMVLGGVAVVAVLQNSLVSTHVDTVTALVDEDAQTLAADGLSALATGEVDRGADSILVQVIDASGSLVYTSEQGRRWAASTQRPAAGTTVVEGFSRTPLSSALQGPLVVLKGVSVAGADWVVLASASQEPQEEAVTTTATILALGIPLLVALAAAVTWWRVGRALRSVESIRTRVERIGATAELHERVPVPDTADEIAHLATTMNLMLERLEAAQSAQRRFVADASHELRSPLATLTASVDVAGADESGTTWQELAPVLRSETSRMSRLVGDLLVLSRSDAGAPGALARHCGDVDLDDLADRECRRARQVSDLTDSHRVVVELDAQTARVDGDEHQLTQVLRNVIDNAMRSAVSRVRVSVSTGSEGVATVLVADDGAGIPPADRERVFDRFVRLDESRSRESGGSGLGLPIARQLVTAHGGTITVGASATLGGAEVTIRLPRRTA